MGKRSDFPRRPMDDYETPAAAVLPLLRHLGDVVRFAEPCAGRGHLLHHLERAGLECVYAADIRTGINPPGHFIDEGVDALAVGRAAYRDAEVIITNPPWTRELLHPLITHFSHILPTWLLFDADWSHTRQSAPLIHHCVKIVSVGRVRWIEGTKHTGKDNAAWHLFDRKHVAGPLFIGRTAHESKGKKQREEVRA